LGRTTVVVALAGAWGVGPLARSPGALGASGVIGQRLVPLLVGAGHDVAGMTRTPAKVDRLREQGAEPVVSDVFDLEVLRVAITGFEPDLVISQLTGMPDDRGRIPEHARGLRRRYRSWPRAVIRRLGAGAITTRRVPSLATAATS
jgi:uncharacterized protein YbjT (DUF2867 family)